jgi:hypothetical protein
MKERFHSLVVPRIRKFGQIGPGCDKQSLLKVGTQSITSGDFRSHLP